NEYGFLSELLKKKNGISSLEDRKKMAASAFNISSNYDTAIFNYFNQSGEIAAFKMSMLQSRSLRYGENPHQRGIFYGDFNSLFDQFQGKEISYNNLLDIDAAVSLMSEFTEPTAAIIKHNNACGLA